MHRGYIKLHRKITEWEWYEDTNAFRLFIHFLLKANHKDKKWKGILIKKGSFVTGYDKLSQELKLSKQQIRTAMNKLKSTHEITHQHNNLFSVVTLINYDSYQDRDLIEASQSTHQSTFEQQSSNSQVTPTKNVKNDKKGKNRDLFAIDNAKNIKPMEVVELFNQTFEDCYVRQTKATTTVLLKRISILTKEHFDSLEKWTTFFNAMKLSDYLMGKVPPSHGYRQFKLKLEWILSEKKLAKFINGDYHEQT